MFQAEGTACAKSLETRKNLVCLRNTKHISTFGLQQAWSIGRVSIIQRSVGHGNEFRLYFKLCMLKMRPLVF